MKKGISNKLITFIISLIFTLTLTPISARADTGTFKIQTKDGIQVVPIKALTLAMGGKVVEGNNYFDCTLSPGKTLRVSGDLPVGILNGNHVPYKTEIIDGYPFPDFYTPVKEKGDYLIPIEVLTTYCGVQAKNGYIVFNTTNVPQIQNVFTGSQISKSLPNLGWYSYNGGYAWNKYGKNKDATGILGKISVPNGKEGNDVILTLQGYSPEFKTAVINTLKLIVPTQYNAVYTMISNSTANNGKTVNLDGRNIAFKVEKNGVITVTFGGVNASTITSIADISINVYRGDKYTLPSTVTAKLANGKTKQVPVKWNVPIVGTDKVGTFTFTGTVSGYSNKVKLTLTVKPLTIVSIANISATVNQKDNYTLPATVTAKLNNGTTGQYSVKWNVSKANTSKAGTFTYLGTVNGYKNKVKLTLTVTPSSGKIYTGSQIAGKLAQYGWYPVSGGYAWNKYADRGPAGELGTISIPMIDNTDVILTLRGYSPEFGNAVKNTLKLILPTKADYLYNYISNEDIQNGKTMNLDNRTITFKTYESGAIKLYFSSIKK